LLRRALFGMPSHQFSQPAVCSLRDCACVLQNRKPTSANVLHMEALTSHNAKRKKKLRMFFLPRPACLEAILPGVEKGGSSIHTRRNRIWADVGKNRVEEEVQ
jgi:hypothetical protein